LRWGTRKKKGRNGKKISGVSIGGRLGERTNLLNEYVNPRGLNGESRVSKEEASFSYGLEKRILAKTLFPWSTELSGKKGQLLYPL